MNTKNMKRLSMHSWRLSSVCRKWRTLQVDNRKWDSLTFGIKSASSRSLFTSAGRINESETIVCSSTRLFIFGWFRLYSDNTDEAVRLCEALLEEPELDPAVRIGDAFGFIVEHHCQQGNYQMVTEISYNYPEKWPCLVLKETFQFGHIFSFFPLN